VACLVCVPDSCGLPRSRNPLPEISGPKGPVLAALIRNFRLRRVCALWCATAVICLADKAIHPRRTSTVRLDPEGTQIMRLPNYTLVSETEGRFTYKLRPGTHTRVSGLITAWVSAPIGSGRGSQEVPGTPWLRVEMSPPQLLDNSRVPVPCGDPLTVNGRIVPHSYCSVRLHRFGRADTITVLGSTGHPSTSFPIVGLTDAAERTLNDFFGVLASELMTDERAAGVFFDDAQERLARKTVEYDDTMKSLRADIDALTATRDERAAILAQLCSADPKDG